MTINQLPMYHKPVLLNESVEMLNIQPGGIYVDATFGGGGHTSAILEKMSEGKIYAFDQDIDAHQNALGDPRLKLIHANFRYMSNFLNVEKVIKVDGVLVDLGVSSHQFDEGERGFSFRYDAYLDMRMNQSQGKKAGDVLADYSKEELYRIFNNYSDIKNVKKLVERIIVLRAEGSFLSTQKFANDIENCLPKKGQNKYLAQVFQALRIEVNDEIQALKDLLMQSVDILKEGGRLVVLSYHSIEDRIVKRFINSGNFENKLERDFYGNIIKPFKSVLRKVMVPQEEELLINNRARSAKMRVAERIAI